MRNAYRQEYKRILLLFLMAFILRIQNNMEKIAQGFLEKQN